MGRSNGILQRGGALVAVLGCIFAPTTSAQAEQITVPLVDVPIEVGVDATLPPLATEAAAPPVASPVPVPATTTNPTVPIVAVSTPTDAPAPASTPSAGGSGSSGEESPIDPVVPPAGGQRDASVPTTPRLPVSTLDVAAPGFIPPAYFAAATSPEPAPVVPAYTHTSTQRRVLDVAATEVDHAARTPSTIIPGQESPALQATSEPARTPSAVGGSSSAPAGIVPQVDAPSSRFPSQVVDDVAHVWNSHRRLLRIERPG